LIAASVIPLVIDCGRVLSLDIGDREESVQQALAQVCFALSDGVFVD
jgi:zinc transporter 5/7